MSKKSSSIQSKRDWQAGKTKLADILKESKRRNDILFGAYDPITGIGSLIPRKEIRLSKNDIQHWPVQMFKIPLVEELAKIGLAETVKLVKSDETTVKQLLFKLRIRYDYEFWAYTCAKIKNKRGELVPFLFNPSQRKSIAERESLRAQGRPVWQIELKDRQYGSSTEKNAYIFWLQNEVYRNHNSYIISLEKDVVIDIVDRYERIAENYPAFIRDVKLTGYRGSRNTIHIQGQESFIYLGSVERPNAPSGRTPQHVLISEAGKMKETDVKSATDLITNIVSMVPEESYTTLLIESTAHQSGKWFRDECNKALRGESGYHLTFINWMTNPEKWKDDYRVNNERVDVRKFIDHFRDYDWLLWEEGASLEQINWYKMREQKYPHEWQMKQENPTWPEEAFQTTESRYFPIEYVKNIGKSVKEPIAIGNIVSDAQSGKDAFTNIRFEEAKDGRVWIWEFPDDILPKDSECRDQTCCFMDVGGRAQTSDKHAATILNRFWMIEMGIPEVVAEYRGNLDLDLAAWEVAKLSYWYHQALLAIEVNTIINKAAREGTYEGEGSLAILNEINGVYPRLYARTLPENRDSGRPLKKLGFHMNALTKVMLYGGLTSAMREYGYVERSSRAIHEMNVCVLTSDGKIQAMDGENDDLIDTRGGAYWLATDYMRPPELFVRDTSHRSKRRKKTEADY